MNARAGVVALLSFSLLGPLWIVAGIVLVPEGCTYPALRTGSVPSNLIFLSTDRLRAADLRVEGADPWAIHPRYPALARLANRGITIVRAYAASDRSPAAEASFVFSLLPTSHDVREWDRKATARLPTIFETFSGRGYATAAFANLPLLWKTGLGKGTDSSLELDADDVDAAVDAAGAWMETIRDRQFVFWIHFSARPGASAAATLDRLVERTVDLLRRRRRYEESCVIAFSTSTGAKADLEVPMIVRLPADDITDAVRRGPISVLDLYPTMAKMFRVPIHRVPHVGRSLLDPPHKPLFSGNKLHGLAPFEHLDARGSTIGVGANNFVLLDEGGEETLFDRDVDPDGEHPLALEDQASEVATSLRELLARAKELRLPGVGSTRFELEPAALRRLERLGHLPGDRQR